ncbi:hypothetical protein GCM10022393_35820 [Aquimarina addita]|uniref:Carbohydrate-binding domain-containing protein n=1 Tax=Aquimarina addita TaxID=870485 RepID=A0ABP6UQT2_9FLAO
MKRTFIFLCIVTLTICCKKETKTNTKDVIAVLQEDSTIPQQRKKDHQLREVKKAVIAPNMDGSMDDPIWKETKWYAIDQLWIGDQPTLKDYFGRYKISWTPDALYILVEIKDDIISNSYKDPLVQWWDNDCVEIFIDADNSGGEHQFNNNAFAYHVALDGNVVDLDVNQQPILHNSHVITKRTTKGDVSIWEFEVSVFDDTYEEGKTNDPLVLTKNQKIGFAIAYNDNDQSKERENFMGSVFVPGEDKNQGWINADIFGTILLVE